MKAGWEVKALGEVIEKVETVDPTKTPDLEFDYVDVSSVSNETFQIEQSTRTLGADAPSRARRKIRTGDVIFATVRPTLQRIAFVPPELDEQICSTGYMVLRAKPSTLPKYLYYFLFSDSFSEAMEDLQKGASYPAVTDGEVRDQPIPLPPLDEQKRIVAVLDAAFEGLSRARAHTETNLQNARELGTRSIDAMLEETNPDFVSLGSVCRFENGDRGKNYPGRKAFVPEGVPFINAGHLLNGPIDWEQMNYIPEEHFHRLSNGKVHLGDILFCLRGSLGKFGIVDSSGLGAIASSLVIVRPKQSLHSGYLAAFLRSARCAEEINRFANGAAQPNLSAKNLGEFQVPLPSYEEQASAVSRIDAIIEVSAELQSHYRAKLADLDALRQALLQKAFAGELT